MPFADPLVGAVGTHQNVYQRNSSVWRRVADWLVNLRYLDYVPAMGRAGAVPCVSGRTAVYRRAPYSLSWNISKTSTSWAAGASRG